MSGNTTTSNNNNRNHNKTGPKISGGERTTKKHTASSVVRGQNATPDGSRSKPWEIPFGIWWKKIGVPLLVFTVGTFVTFLFTSHHLSEDHRYLQRVFTTMGEAVATGTFVALEAGIRENSIATTLEEIGTLRGPYLAPASFAKLATGLLGHVGERVLFVKERKNSVWWRRLCLVGECHESAKLLGCKRRRRRRRRVFRKLVQAMV